MFSLLFPNHSSFQVTCELWRVLFFYDFSFFFFTTKRGIHIAEGGAKNCGGWKNQANALFIFKPPTSLQLKTGIYFEVHIHSVNFYTSSFLSSPLPLTLYLEQFLKVFFCLPYKALIICVCNHKHSETPSQCLSLQDNSCHYLLLVQSGTVKL